VNPIGAPASPGPAIANASATPSPNAAAAAGGDSSSDPAAGSNVVVSTGAPANDPSDHSRSATTAPAADPDWAHERKKRNSVPIRRTIQIIVRGDHLAILADDAQIDYETPAGQRVDLPGDTVESLDVFSAAIRRHVEGWGIAGERLYWRPVLVLNVGPDGQRRADDLARLLGDSGFELRTAKRANTPTQGKARATR
jgi:hypothetical protein